MSEDPDNIRALADTASQHFRDQSYTKAIEHLNKLRKVKDGADPRILHNLAVAEYYLAKCGDSQKLIDDLTKTKGVMDTKSTEVEADSEGTTTPHAELDASMVQYNKAVVYMRAKQYNTSLDILEELYRNIEPIEDFLALRICFLLIDIYLRLKHTEKGFGVVAYLEKLFANVLKSDDKSTANTAALATQEEDANGRGKGSEEGNTPKFSLKLSPNELKFILHMYKAKLHLQKKANLKAAKQEIKLAMIAGTKVHPLSVPVCMFLKAHLEYARQNHKKAIKLMNACGQKSSLPAAVTSPPADNGCVGVNCSIDGSLPPLYFNNLGCISYKMKKFNASSFYLGKALKENVNSSEDSASSTAESSSAQGKKSQQTKTNTPAPGRDHQAEILYNMGMQLLLTGKPELAFQAFQEAALVYYRTPFVWLRLAECCVAVHVLRLREDAKTRQKSSLIWRVSNNVHVNSKGNPDISTSSRLLLPIGGGPHKGLQVEDTDSPSEESEESLAGGVHMGTLSLEFAAKALRNCIFLLSKVPESENSNGSSNHAEEAEPSSTGESLSAPESELRQSALVNLAFVSLALNNPVVALKSASEVLALKTGVIDIYKYLSHLYAAEALLTLNKPAQAIQHLTPSMLDEIFPPPPSSSSSSSSSTPFTLVGVHHSPYSSLTSSQPVPNVARSMLCTNLAAAHILRDDLAQAQSCVSQALQYQPSSSRALLVQVYLDIRRGNHEPALDILKRGRPVPKRKTRR